MKISNYTNEKPVFIIILNWNGWEDTTRCVESCRMLSYPNFRIMIVDNGSTDGSEAVLRKRFPDIELIQTGGNLGFAGGNNLGIRHALEEGADYLWLLNNDTLVATQCLTHMVQAAESDNRIGMVGSKIFYHHAPGILWYAGGEVDLDGGGLTRHIGQNDTEKEIYDQPGDTGYITGCSLLARREMIEDIGLLEEKYFLYFEDADWSLRAKAKGWRLFYQPKARLWHKEGAQNERMYSNRFIYYFIRNRFFFMRRFAPRKMLRCHLLQIKTALFFLKEAIRHRPKSVGKTVSLVLAAYGDFFRSRMGAKEDL